VLRTEEDFIVLDFEGDPADSIVERRAKQSPLKDVAGMIRSYGYAAYAALFAFALQTPSDYAALEPWARTWQHWTADAFLKGYLAGINETQLLPRAAGERRALLSAFTLDKALRELSYELHNRPDWVRVPLVGLHTLIRTDW
jgi:maltose alpha-D-glucosyltransferase/alpha-amylase